jgi:hypothetical protein
MRVKGINESLSPCQSGRKLGLASLFTAVLTLAAIGLAGRDTGVSFTDHVNRGY